MQTVLFEYVLPADIFIHASLELLYDIEFLLFLPGRTLHLERSACQVQALLSDDETCERNDKYFSY